MFSRFVNADSSCTIIWNTIIGASEYEAELYINSSLIDTTSVTSPSISITKLVAADYLLKVRTVKKTSGKTYYSEWTEFIFTGTDPRLRESDLGKVSNICQDCNENKTKITITWDSVIGATEYEIELCNSNEYIATYTVTSPSVTLDFDENKLNIAMIRAVRRVNDKVSYSEKVICAFGGTYFIIM